MAEGHSEAERGGFPIEKPVAEINGDTLPSQLAAIVKAGNAADVVRRKAASQLDPKIPKGDEFQFELLVPRAVSSALLAEASGGLALKFALAGVASVGADHEGKQMLGVDALGMNAACERQGETYERRPDSCCDDSCADGHPDSEEVVENEWKVTVPLTRGRNLSQCGKPGARKRDPSDHSILEAIWHSMPIRSCGNNP